MLDGKLLIGGKWKNGDRTFESERAKIFTMIGDELLKRSHEISKLITLEMGRPLFESNIEIRMHAASAMSLGRDQALDIKQGQIIRVSLKKSAIRITKE